MERERQTLHIESHAGGEVIRTSVQARATFTPNHVRWIYTEKLSEDEAPVAETLEAELDEEGRVLRAHMKRVGGFTLHFEEGREWRSEMRTPAGRLEVQIQTTRLTGRANKNRIDLSIAYRLFLGGEESGSVEIRYWSEPLEDRKDGAM